MNAVPLFIAVALPMLHHSLRVAVVTKAIAQTCVATRHGMLMKCLSFRFLVVVVLLAGAVPIQAQLSQRVKLLNPIYRHWLDDDVRWIMTDEERQDFLRLANDLDRNKFIEEFWQKRNPEPGSIVNRFRVEHYRRIEYANLNFSTPSMPGWETDRGRIYIIFGPPNEIKVEPATKDKPPIDSWHYEIPPNATDKELCEDYLMLCGWSEINSFFAHPGAPVLDVSFNEGREVRAAERGF